MMFNIFFDHHHDFSYYLFILTFFILFVFFILFPFNRKCSVERTSKRQDKNEKVFFCEHFRIFL